MDSPVRRSWTSALVQAVRLRLGPYDDPRPLALLRISLGLVTILNVAAVWPLAELLFADQGLFPRAVACGGMPARLSLLCHLPEAAVPWLFAALVAVAGRARAGRSLRAARERADPARRGRASLPGGLVLKTVLDLVLG